MEGGAVVSAGTGCVAEVATEPLALMLERMLTASAGSRVRVSVESVVGVGSMGIVTVTVTISTPSVWEATPGDMGETLGGEVVGKAMVSVPLEYRSSRPAALNIAVAEI